MKFIAKTISYRLLVFVGFIFLSAFLPLKVFALSVDGQQHFTPASTSNWVVTSGGNGYALHLGSIVTDEDPYDVSPQYAALWSGTATTTGVTVTYTDPAPATPQNFLKIDLNTTGVNQEIEIIATDGTNTVTALAGSADILPNCFLSNPVSQTTTDTNTWETAFIDVSSLGAITSVQFIFQDNGSIEQFTGTVYLDNLRGESQITCLTPTNTATQTATNTATDTPINSETFTNTATESATNTPTLTGTYTPTNSPTHTPTNTATKTPVNTSTNTPTSTPTSTPGLTNTPTITNTPTPAPCQIEVYPNPMDFTASHTESNVPTGSCHSGKCVVFSCLPLNATVKIYTVSLSLVREFPVGSVVGAPSLPAGVGLVAWDGTNGNAAPVASGLYFYVVNAPGVNTFGKFAISKSMYGP